MDCEYVPEACVWELTLRCNMRCIHCGSSAGKSRENELTVEECLEVADDLVDMGCRHVTFIGGEVFLYDGWEKSRKENSMREEPAPTSLLTPFCLEKIRSIRLSMLISPMSESLWTGWKTTTTSSGITPSPLNGCSKPSRCSAQENISIGVVTSLMDINYPDLERLYHLLVENQVSVWQIQLATAMGNME